MATFNKKAWVDSVFAKSRFYRHPARKSYVDRQLKLVDDFEKLVGWARRRGVRVEIDNSQSGGLFLIEEKLIRVSSRSSLEKRVCYFLHECGHLLINSTEDHERFGMGYPTVFSNDFMKGKKPFKLKCTIVDEEFEAWARGWKLAKKLSINVDKKTYDAVRCEGIKSYMKWALGVGDVQLL